jgi:membrane-associated phospholipid phosphatase
MTKVPRRNVLAFGGGALAALLGDTRARAQSVVAPAPQPAGTSRPGAVYDVRIAAAKAERSRPVPNGRTNGDERRFANGVVSFTKGLPHGANGEVDSAAFAALLDAVRSGDAAAFEKVPVPGDVRLVNPQAAWSFSLDGPDPQSLPLPPPPEFASAAQAADACELYWQAVTRDVPYADYDRNPLIGRACDELSRLTAFSGPRDAGRVTPAIAFRGLTPGDLTGPYISQFLLKEVPYGAIRLVPHVRTATPGLDYLVTWDNWLAVQNGTATVSRHAGAYRYIRTARDLAAYVQLDFSYQPFLTACLVLFGMEGTTDVRRPYKGAPFDRAIPYRTSTTQSGFATLGVAHVLDLVARVAQLALLHAWHHKWSVHRTLRPEEFGGRVHAQRTGVGRYPIHDSLLSASVLDVVHERHGTYLLPQAYPEGAPLHPSYPSGHAVIAGACATVLKAFFDETFSIEEPVVARPDGLSLEPYSGTPLTVGGELNKLAANIALGRGAAGIHWRYDGSAGLSLGEAIALEVLANVRRCVHEPFPGFSLTRFDQTPVTV